MAKAILHDRNSRSSAVLCCARNYGQAHFILYMDLLGEWRKSYGLDHINWNEKGVKKHVCAYEKKYRTIDKNTNNSTTMTMKS